MIAKLLNKKIFSSFVLGVLLFPILVTAKDDDSNNRPGRKHKSAVNGVYKIEIHNQTETQWFSPCLCVLHDEEVDLFQVGQAATTGQATFAEDGFNGVLAQELRENPNVFSVLECEPGLTPPEATRVEFIEGPINAKLTCAAMPVTTNDVLTVIDSKQLPKRLGRKREFASIEWNLGSEVNDYSADSMPEDSANLVPEGPDNPVTISDNVVFGPEGRPVGVPSLLSPFTRFYFNDQGEFIAEGTMNIFTEYVGSDEFPAEIYGWSAPASRVSVTRID